MSYVDEYPPLVTCLRQFRSNSKQDFVTGYDKELTEKLFRKLDDQNTELFDYLCDMANSLDELLYWAVDDTPVQITTEAENLIKNFESKFINKGEWRPIETAPISKNPILAINIDGIKKGYTSDPYCVLHIEKYVFERWPWVVPPTHWAPVPPVEE